MAYVLFLMTLFPVAGTLNTVSLCKLEMSVQILADLGISYIREGSVQVGIQYTGELGYNALKGTDFFFIISECCSNQGV
jgi:hypothetical protein